MFHPDQLVTILSQSPPPLHFIHHNIENNNSPHEWYSPFYLTT
ncbi:hypothetical protein C1A50_2839 [Paenibacillus polymyxa]|nr:hypothetical protein C1A50_2839 [Paenibacillus polymyxa]